MTSTAAVSLVLLAAAFASGCAADSPAAVGSESRTQPEYRTGSNIPVRDPRPTTEAERARAATQVEEMRRNGGKPLN